MSNQRKTRELQEKLEFWRSTALLLTMFIIALAPAIKDIILEVLR